MRIASLALRPYGAYREETPLRLDPSKKLHIIYGLNESGKTTRRNALTDLLFGFKHQTDYDFAFGPSTLRIGASIEANGQTCEIERRKGKADTLRDPSGSPISEAFLRTLLGGLDRDTYSTRFSFGAQDLKLGSELLLSSGGDVGYNLYGAALGGIDPRTILLELEREAEALFKPRGQTMKINALVSAHAQALKRVSECAHQPAEVRELEERKTRITERLQNIDTEQGGLQQQALRLEAIVNAIKQHEEYKELRLLINEAQARERLPDELADALGEALQRTRELERREAEQREARERIDLNPPRIDEALLAEGPAVDALAAALSTVRTSTETVREQRIEERARENARIFEQLKERYWPGITETVLLERNPNKKAFAEAQKLANDHAALLASQASAARAYEKALREQKAADEDTAVNGAPLETAMLRSAVEASQTLGGNVDELLAGQNAALRAERSSLDKRIGALRFFTGPAPALLECKFPSAQEITCFSTQERQIRERERTLREQNARTCEALAQAERVVREHDEAGDVGVEERIIAARHEREERFTGVEHAWKTGAAYDPEKPEAYRRAAHAADKTVDAFRERADAAARAERAVRDLNATRSALADISAALETVSDERNAYITGWKGLWEPAGVAPEAPEVMNAWLTEIKELVNEERAYAGKELEAAQLRARRDASYGALTQELTHLQQNHRAETNRTLAALTAHAARIVERARDEHVRREQSVKQRERASAALESTQNECRRIETEMRRCDERRRALLASLHLAPETRADIINAALEDLRTLFEAHAACRRDQAVLESTHNEERRYRESAAALLDRVCPDLRPMLDQALPATIETLRTRLAQARASKAQLLEREEQIRRVSTEGARIEEALHISREQRDALLHEAGVPLEGIDVRLNATLELRRLRAEGEREERALRLACRSSVEEIDAAVERHGYEGLRSELLRVEDELEQRQSERDRLIEERKEAAEHYARLDSSDAASQAQGDALALAGEIDRHARRYAALVTARTMLAEEIDRYTQSHQTPIITAASRYIGLLTEQRYTRVQVVNKGERPTIEILHAQGEREIEQLSDGTRDQVYLALRLAVLEEYFRTMNPVPLIVDDALLTFDDPRTKAALAAFQAFGAITQVLYFTHHRRVVDIARELMGAEADVVEIS